MRSFEWGKLLTTCLSQVSGFRDSKHDLGGVIPRDTLFLGANSYPTASARGLLKFTGGAC